MKKINLSVIPAALLLVVASSVAQAESVGRVLVAVGDTTALRNGTVVRLARGAEVLSGDTLRVGESSNMQVRFSDEGVTALRSNSVLRIDDYKFERDTNVGKSFFSLVKGGMRSITGLIGRFNRENYAVRAQTATIGIRGTHFVLAQCSNDCFNKDGSKAENGLFGGVTDGRIAVNNQAGEKEFGKNEFFHVPSSEASPKPLLAPPSFLRDQLEGQSKSEKGKTTVAKATGAAESENGDAANGDKAESGESQESAESATVAEGSETTSATTEQQTNTAVTTQPTDGMPVLVQVDTQFVPVEQAVVQQAATGGLINTVQPGQVFPYQMTMVNAWAGTNNWTDAFGSGTWLFGWSEAWVDKGALTIIDPTKLMQAKDAIFADFVINQTPVTTFLMNAYSGGGISDYYYITGNCGWNCVGTLAGTVSFNWAKSASTNVGGNAAAGNLSWGRFTHTYSDTVLTGTYAGNTHSETSYEHWATGDIPNFAALPAAGTFSYSYIGGTRPTDQNGNLGTINNGGTVSINFTGVGLATVSVSGTSWTMPATGNTYSVNIAAQSVSFTQQSYSFANAGFADAGTTSYITPIQNVGVTCLGACTSGGTTPIGVTSSTISPMLFGANAQGLAVGISTSLTAATGTSPAENTASVQVYQAGTPPM